MVHLMLEVERIEERMKMENQMGKPGIAAAAAAGGNSFDLHFDLGKVLRLDCFGYYYFHKNFDSGY